MPYTQFSSQIFMTLPVRYFVLTKCILKNLLLCAIDYLEFVWGCGVPFLEFQYLRGASEVFEKCIKDSLRRRDHRVYRIHKYILVRFWSKQVEFWSDFQVNLVC